MFSTAEFAGGLRVGEIRVFYDIIGQDVEVLALIPKSQASVWLEEWPPWRLLVPPNPRCSPLGPPGEIVGKAKHWSMSRRLNFFRQVRIGWQNRRSDSRSALLSR